MACHWVAEQWKFAGIGNACIDCHTDIHKDLIDVKYYPNSTCLNCHTTDGWNRVCFDHSVTGFVLEGAHQKQSCRSCHFRKNGTGSESQQFAGLTPDCSNCHDDIHFKQFAIDNRTDCRQCHSFDNWSIGQFDHDQTAFKLEGKHISVPCGQCHKPVEVSGLTYVLYKINDTRCESCHLQ